MLEWHSFLVRRLRCLCAFLMRRLRRLCSFPKHANSQHKTHCEKRYCCNRHEALAAPLFFPREAPSAPFFFPQTPQFTTQDACRVTGKLQKNAENPRNVKKIWKQMHRIGIVDNNQVCPAGLFCCNVLQFLSC